MISTRICTVCGEPIPIGENGNRKVHPHCEKNRKDEYNATRSDRLRPMDTLAIRLDRILERYYTISPGDATIDRDLLTNEDFKWDFISAISSSKPPIFWILNFGYSYLDKSKIIIHYGNNPLRQLQPPSANNGEV